MEPSFSASLMCMDFLNVKNEIEVLNDQVDYFHIDIIDGIYSKNLSLSPDLIKAFKKVTRKPMEAHLATVNPEDWIQACAEAGVQTISPQADTIINNAFRIFNLIESYKCKVGLVINPAMPVRFMENCLGRVDLLTIMTVDPGFPGQKFVEEALNNIKEAARIRKEHNFSYKIQVDGSVNKNTYKALKEAGADIYILGSSGLFNLDKDISKACNQAYREFDIAVLQ